MGAMILKCHKCGRNYAVNNIKDVDIHRCECGSALTWKNNYVGSCETADMPNEPYEKKQPCYDHSAPMVCAGEGKELVIPKNLSKKVTIDVEAGKGFDKLLGVVKELSKSIEDIPGLVMIDNDGKVNVVPAISIDSKMIVFRTITPYRKCDREELAKEYTDKLGIKCEVIDARTELAAVIDG